MWPKLRARLAALLAPLLAALLYGGAALAQAPLEVRGYDPQCGEDAACAVWARFRSQHPFPYRAIAAAPAERGALALIISEPPEHVSRTELARVVRETFGADLFGYADRRWMIGQDGWLEDAVASVRWSAAQAAHADPLRDAATRRRVAALFRALYGTPFGGDLVDPLAPYAVAGARAAPQAAPTPAELHAWLDDPDAQWRPINPALRAAPQRHAQLWADGASGGFIDSANQLAIFLVPVAARADARAVENLRIPFRYFAVACDAMLGGAWNGAGDATLICRARRAPLAAVPPLRFETFALLARETRSELQQSYERDNPLAGKLLSGDNALRDWAPILLSDSLIDTELGALLNITDQILKSWSEAGRVRYLYFDYPLRPAPGAFAFGDRRLSRIVAGDTGAAGVLFNWNTAGAAAAMEYGPVSVLAAGRTSALPVAYGSETAARAMRTGADLPRLRALENEAYDYFTARRDPNLARVASYTVMYQVLRAANLAAGMRAGDPPNVARAASHAALVAQMREVIDAALSDHPGAIKPELAPIAEREAPRLRAEITQFTRRWRAYRDRDALARLLADPRAARAAEDAAFRADAARLRARFQDVAFLLHDLGAASSAYVAGAGAAPPGRIKTPSIVLSWDDTDLYAALVSVGGHNLAARALRIVNDPGVSTLVLENRAGAKVLRVPPSMAAQVSANAHAISRLVEHENGDAAAIRRLLGAGAPAAPVRAPSEALGEGGADLGAFGALDED